MQIKLLRKKEDKKIQLKEASTNYIGLFIKGFALNIINIAVLLFWAGVILVVVPNLNRTNSLGVFTFFTTILGTYFITDVLKIFIAKKLTSKINTEIKVFVAAKEVRTIDAYAENEKISCIWFFYSAWWSYSGICPEFHKWRS